MIVPMRKVYLIARQTDREPLLAILRELGIVHLVPVDPALAVPGEALSRQIDAIKQAVQVVSGIEPRGPVPDIPASEAAHEVLDIRRRVAEGRNHLAALYHQLEQIAVWDDLRLKHVEELRQAGVNIEFFAVPASAFGRIEAECVAEVGELSGREIMVAAVDRGGGIVVPEEARPMRLPSRDAAAIRAEAKQIDESLHRNINRLHELAQVTPALEAELLRLEQQAEETIAVRGAAADEDLFAVQGWLPAENVSNLQERLSRRSMPAVLEVLEAAEDEQPPTLVRPPRWARPIEGLFKMLGTVPGYREFDVSIPFLIALPIFTAILVGDAGYGAVLLLGPALAYRRTAKALGARFTQLLMIIGAVSVVWGALTNSFFGFQVLPATLIPIELSEGSRTFMMRLSFILGAIHLCVAQLWQAVRHYPDLRWLNKLGWAMFVGGMYGVVNMFVLQGPMTWRAPWPYLLIAGAALAILFAHPSRRPLVTIGVGLAQFPLSMLSAFSDVISYVRLMAVGLASSVLAASFNEMALGIGIWPLTALVLVLGHGLNIGLAMIAMFAHGVRLNMLEFSNNLGMQWTGYPYKPFAHQTR
jgi:V/A-type H+-transporting ATPase subunit I